MRLCNCPLLFILRYTGQYFDTAALVLHMPMSFSQIDYVFTFGKSAQASMAMHIQYIYFTPSTNRSIYSNFQTSTETSTFFV